MGGVYRETDDLPCVEVNDGGDIYEPPLKWDVREVGTPDMVFIHWAGRHKKVGVNNLDIVGLLPLPASPAICFDAEYGHHSFHWFSIHLEVDGDAT